MAFDTTKIPKHIKTENIDVPSGSTGGGIPNVKLMQALSPELDKDEDKYVKGAVPGDLVVTDGTNSVLIKASKGLVFSPVAVKKSWTEWVPRDQGGGFVASYNSKEEAEAGLEKGNDLNVSIDYLIACPELGDDIEFILLSFNTPTKMKGARELANAIQQYKTMSGVQYRLSSAKQKNKKNQSFFNFAIEPIGWTEKSMYTAIEAAKDAPKTLFLPE